uniref:Glycosyltransferase n=1 Tax=Steinernema glaseri TaxID=37863 RepID=A0A1I8A9I4_9BILA
MMRTIRGAGTRYDRGQNSGTRGRYRNPGAGRLHGNPGTRGRYRNLGAGRLHGNPGTGGRHRDFGTMELWVRHIIWRFHGLHPNVHLGYNEFTLRDVQRLSDNLRHYGVVLTPAHIVHYIAERNSHSASRRYQGSLFGKKSRARANVHRADRGNTGAGENVRLRNGILEFRHRIDGWIRSDAPGYYNVVNPVVFGRSIHYRERLPRNFETEEEFDAVVPGYQGINNFTPVEEFPGLVYGEETEEEAAAIDCYYKTLSRGTVEQFRPVLSFDQMLDVTYFARLTNTSPGKFMAGLRNRNLGQFRNFLNQGEAEEHILRQARR